KGDSVLARSREVSMRKTLIVGRWEGDAARLRDAIANRTEFAALADCLVETAALKPEAGVRYLEQRLGFDIGQRFARRNVTVTFDAGLRAALEQAYAKAPQAGFDRFHRGLHTAMIAWCQNPPPFKDKIEISLRNLGSERDEFIAGRAVSSPF